jgi:hypothetical protein
MSSISFFYISYLVYWLLHSSNYMYAMYNYIGKVRSVPGFQFYSIEKLWILNEPDLICFLLFCVCVGSQMGELGSTKEHGNTM